MMGESGGHKDSVNVNDMKTSYCGCPSYGLFQINGPDNWLWGDPESNVNRARQIYLRRGWTPWGAYTSKRFMQYINK
jgi:hypothetical protein